MINYEESSDFEINKAVAKALGILKDNVDLVGCGDSIQLFDFDKSVFIDYCNNPSDAWPIILENKISLISEWPDNDWQACVIPTLFTRQKCYHKNPFRAAMIVFLKMQEQES